MFQLKKLYRRAVLFPRDIVELLKADRVVGPILAFPQDFKQRPFNLVEVPYSTCGGTVRRVGHANSLPEGGQLSSNIRAESGCRPYIP